MSEIQLEIVTTEENVFSGKVDFVGVKSVDGRLGILPKHVSLITELADGEVNWRNSSGNKNIYLTGGFMEVINNSVTILADSTR
ncbi:MAG: ATP synthase F1 subunit epsilon [Actinobacteria bacterium]|nr:ATP synthase F1 subunit epsilon [Actinomycetota bacterium]